MFYTELLDDTTVNAFERLTHTEFRSLLQKSGGGGQALAIGALVYPGQPIGLILGELNNEGCLLIQTVFVKPKYRRLGVATTLLREIEQAAANRKCSLMNCGFIEDHPENEHFTRLLQKCGWQPPETNMLLYKMDMAGLKEEDCPLFTVLELPETFKVSAWQDLSESELACLKTGEGVWYSRLTSPFLEQERVDTYNSVFLKNENEEIIGWTIAHRLDSDTILYRNIFAKEEYRSMGYAMLLMGKAIWRQYDRGIYKLMFCVHVKNKGMNRIINRFMKPFNYTVKQKLQFDKYLGQLREEH